MKSKVSLSLYCITITTVIINVLVVLSIISFAEKTVFVLLLSILVLLLVFGGIYAPLSVNADDRYVIVRSLLRQHRIAINGIARAERFSPTMGAIRLCASGGFMGYWGLFREGDIGRYMAYYGKASDCILIRMKNGYKYVIGCDNPDAVLEHIRRF